MDPLLVILLLLFVLAFFGMPFWPYAHDWGYGPSGFFGVLLLTVLLILLFRAFGRRGDL